MNARGKSARTSPEEKTGAAPSVAKLAIDPAGGRGELRALGGGKHDEWNQGLTARLAGALPEARGSMTAATVEGSLGALTGQIGIDPQDPVEGMLSAQMIAANAAVLDLYRRAWIPGQSFEASTRYLALAEKAARTLARLSEALDRHRGKGQQQVKHVTVNADQAVAADTVVGGSKRSVEISKTATTLPSSSKLAMHQALRCKARFEKDREALPITRR
jgi:hypothetical protein